MDLEKLKEYSHRLLDVGFRREDSDMSIEDDHLHFGSGGDDSIPVWSLEKLLDMLPTDIMVNHGGLSFSGIEQCGQIYHLVIKKERGIYIVGYSGQMSYGMGESSVIEISNVEPMSAVVDMLEYLQEHRESYIILG